ncbi:PKD domain-containing protein, partial [Bacteroidia bacterium]|nr:PKD domain-containing protein [Bacteroidia bacterium]
MKNELILYYFPILVFLLIGNSLNAQTIDAGNDTTICFGQSITLGGSIVATGAPDSISWTSSDNFTSTDSTPSVSPSLTTTYYLKVTYSSISTILMDTIVVSVNTISAGRDTVICSGQIIQLGGNPVASGAPSSFGWISIPSGFTSSDSMPFDTILASRQYVLAVSYSTCTIYDTINAIVPLLVTNFGFSADTVCSGTSMSFYDSTNFTSLNTTYTWNFGNGDSSNQQNPSQTFTTSSTGSGSTSYTVILTVSDSGCTSIDTSYILVKNLPDSYHADYDGNAYTNCVGVPAYTLTVINLSSSASTNNSYSLIWGDGDTSNLSNTFSQYDTTIHHYNAQGYFYLEYIVEGNNGCEVSSIDTVFNGSNAHIGLTMPSNLTGCSPYTLSFLINFRNSAGELNSPGTQYTVTSNYPGFNDSIFYQPLTGIPDSNFTFTFDSSSCGYIPNPGTYNGFYVQVEAKNPCSPAYAKGFPIVIQTPVHASFTNSPDPNVCQGSIMNFYGSDSIGSSISGVTSTSTCTHNIKKYWQISPMTGVNITSGSLGANSLFNIGSKNISLRFDSVGTFTIKYILVNNCGADTFTKSICVTPTPNISFTLNDSFFCALDTVSLENLSSTLTSCDSGYFKWSVSGNNECSPDSIGWSYADNTTAASQDPLIRFLHSGVYTITLRDSSACGVYSYSKTTNVGQQPEAFISVLADTICKGSVLSLDSISTLNCHDSSTYLWTYTGGSIQNPNQLNPGILNSDSAGLFVLSFKVTNRCADTIVYDTIRIINPPTVSLSSLSDVCIDAQPFLLTNGTPSGGFYSSLTHNYIVSDTFYPIIAGVGTHYVHYTYSIGYACTSEDSIAIVVHPLPNANAGIDTAICYGDSINLYPTIETNHAYSWYISNSLISSQSTPSIAPTQTTFYILLDSNTITGCTNFDTLKVTVDTIPAINAGSDSSICLNNSIQIGTFLAGYNYSWSSNPSGFSDTASQPTVSPTVTTTYYLSVNEAYQCYNFDTITITVDTLPLAIVGNADSICIYDSIQLGGTSTTGNSYLWTVNSSYLDSTSNPFVQPYVTTLYTLVETNDSTGCQNTDSILITVNQLPNITATDTAICSGDTVTLAASPSNLATYSWSPSSGLLSSTSASVTAFPSQTSEYIVIATDSNGCSGTDTALITVYISPNAIFSIDTGSCGALSLTPDNNTDTSSVFGHDYLWTINPSSGVTLDDTLYEPSIFMPVNNTTSAISYNILLTATSPQGCVDTFLDSTIVYPKPLADFSFSLADSCSPDTAFFTNTSNPYNSETIGSMSFVWDFGSTIQNPNKLYTNSGVVDSLYSVQLISETIHGCRDTIIDTVTIHPDARADFSPTDTIGCAPLTLDSTLINVTQYPFANDTYSWTILDSDSATVLSTFSGTGFTDYTISADADTVYVRLITSNNYGCKNDTLTQRFTTIQDPVADFTLSDTTGCGNTQITLTDATNPTGLDLLWDFGDGDTSTANNPSHLFTNTSNTQDSSYSITLIVTAGTGCSDTIIKSITINPIPKAIFSLSSAATCAPDTLTSTNSSTHKTGTWSSLWTSSHNSVAINNPTDSTPTFSFVDNNSGVDTTYTLSLLVTSVDGCQDSITDSVI